MDLPLQLTFHNIEKTESLENKIRERAAKLEKLFDHIINCRVVVDIPHKHKVRGNLYSIKIEIGVPGDEIVVTRSSDLDSTHKIPDIMIKDAFKAARRQLEDYARKVRGDIKTHEIHPHGRIIEMNKDKGYGKIETNDGRSIYFHKNSVLNENFKILEIGTEVNFVEEQGDEGPQASTVKLVGKHHIVE